MIKKENQKCWKCDGKTEVVFEIESGCSKLMLETCENCGELYNRENVPI